MADALAMGYGRFVEEIGKVAHNSFVHSFAELGFFGGIGGGSALKQLASTKQVLCVTHLPQIASLAELLTRDGEMNEFKKGVEQQLSAEDYETHFNLGIAYKEMGLVDEAEFHFFHFFHFSSYSSGSASWTRWPTAHVMT